MKSLKSILSIVLVMVLVMPPAFATVGAQESATTATALKDKYKEQIYAALELTEFEKSSVEYTYLFEYNADNSPTSDEATPDYVVARIDDINATEDSYEYVVGTYHLGYYKSNDLEIADYYIYSTAEGIAYTPHKLYWNQPPNWQFALHTLEGRDYKYRGVFEDYCLEKNPEYTMEWWPHYARGYDEIYYHYETEPTCDEATPDYVLINAFSDMPPSYAYGVFGDYIVSAGLASPYALPYYVIVPNEDCRVYTLREAYDAGLAGIENVFDVQRNDNSWVGYRIGDADFNRELNVKDVTFIRKCLAGLQNFPGKDDVWGHCETPGFGYLSYTYTDYISDFNRDGKRDIRDATAIQKHLVGISY